MCITEGKNSNNDQEAESRQQHLDNVDELEGKVQRLEEENRQFRQQLLLQSSSSSQNPSSVTAGAASLPISPAEKQQEASCCPRQVDSIGNNDHGRQRLDRDAIERYSRQLLLKDGFGVDGQMKLLQSRVLVVGAGGIGSTVLLYLASAGVGHLTIIDLDIVEMSNLHRQVLHDETKLGINKAVSAKQKLLALNPTITVNALPYALTSDNALTLLQKHKYHCVVDASDNPQTRYIINDACVMAHIPLISGSAIGLQGQLTVYNYNNGPCYRCLYPQPNKIQGGCASCSDAGVLGPVPGLIGILQAMETIKILTEMDNSEILHDKLLMYDALACTFLKVKKPPKRTSCPVCSDTATIRSMADSQANVTDTRGPNTNATIPVALDDSQTMSCFDYNESIRQPNVPHVLLDVRVEQQYDMVHLEGSINIPLERFVDEEDNQSVIAQIEELTEQGTKPIYCICRRGVASAEAVRYLKTNAKRHFTIRNLIGGLVAWQEQVDPSFPKY